MFLGWERVSEACNVHPGYERTLLSQHTMGKDIKEGSGIMKLNVIYIYVCFNLMAKCDLSP